MSKYPVGTVVEHIHTGVRGVVIENFKMPGDICVEFDTSQSTSYDEDVLDESFVIVEETPAATVWLCQETSGSLADSIGAVKEER